MATKNDEDKMKQRGLDASNKEKPVSFFQRLKMGNIDDPKSEAYKKFGAGRGRKDRDDADFAAEEARGKTARSQSGKAPATPKPTRPGQQVSGAKPAAKAKPAIVTKEELAKSGLSLRDYMNKQRGLTRRDGKAPEKAKPATTTSRPATTTSKPAGASGFLDPQSKAQQKAQPSEPATLNKKPPPFEPPVFKFFKSIRERGDADLKSRGMKKGGSVSSASKRADGIAVKGKTRGMVY